MEYHKHEYDMEAEGMGERELELQLVNFICDKCGQVLVQALPAARVLCRKCDHWVGQQSRTGKVCNVAMQKNSISVVCKH